MTDHKTTVLSAVGGSKRAIDSLLERHLPELRAYVRLRSGPAIRAREATVDLAQSVCREALEDLDRFEYRGEAEFKHWLFSKAFNKIRDRVKYYHAKKRNVDLEARAPSEEFKEPDYGRCYADLTTPSRIAMNREELRRVEELFDDLPPDYREVIVLSRVVGLSHAEIARKLNRSEDATRSLLHRAVVRLSWLMSRRAKGKH